ncbi:MAG: hypothetical protein FJ395_11180 [Verrucomicrobia bacterium]|nr:hypothetical protein [Verrucomicrobiota bacterium]
MAKLKVAGKLTVRAKKKPTRFKTVEAEAFVLVTAKGEKRAELSFSKTGEPQLIFWGGKDKRRMELSLFKDEENRHLPKIVLYDEHKQERVSMCVYHYSTPEARVTLSDGHSHGGRLEMAFPEVGAPKILGTDSHGAVTFHLKKKKKRNG